MVGTRQIQCGCGPVRDLRTVSSGRWSYGRYQEASRGNVIPTTRKSVLWLAAPRLFASLSFPSSISSLLAPLCSAYHIVGRFRSVAGRLIWQPTRRGDTDRSRQLIKRFPAYCRAATRFCFVAWPFHRHGARSHLSPSTTHLLHHLIQQSLPTTYLLSPLPWLTSAVHGSCGDEREVDAHSEVRPTLNGRVLIGPRPRLGTSGCPRVEFPPWRLLLPPVVRPDNRLGLSDPRPPTDLLGLREIEL